MVNFGATRHEMREPLDPYLNTLFFNQQRKFSSERVLPTQIEIIGPGVDKLHLLYEALGTKLRTYSFC